MDTSKGPQETFERFVMAKDLKLNNYLHSSFHELVDILNLKTEYSEIIENSNISIPKKYKQLNYESAEWCVEKLSLFNKNSKDIDKLEQICFNYIDLSSYISLSNIFQQHEQGVLDASSTQEQAA